MIDQENERCRIQKEDESTDDFRTRCDDFDRDTGKKAIRKFLTGTLIPGDELSEKKLGWTFFKQHNGESRDDFDKRCDDFTKEIGDGTLREYTECVMIVDGKQVGEKFWIGAD